MLSVQACFHTLLVRDSAFFRVHGRGTKLMAAAQAQGAKLVIGAVEGVETAPGADGVTG